MTEKEFFNAVSNGSEDVLQILLDALASAGVDYCVIGGLAVNAYAEAVVSLDLDIVIAASGVEAICEALKAHFAVEPFAHSVNLTCDKSDLRVQLQTDSRYQEFIGRAATHTVLGYPMKVASLVDVLQGKIWAYSDRERRRSKRQKDLADILRLVEAHPHLAKGLPEEIRQEIE